MILCVYIYIYTHIPCTYVCMYVCVYMYICIYALFAYRSIDLPAAKKPCESMLTAPRLLYRC